MKRALTLLAFLCIVASAQMSVMRRPMYPAAGGGTWSFTQFKFQDSAAGGTGGGTCAAAGTSCQVTISAPTAGHLLIAYSLGGLNGTANMTAPTGGQTWTHCGGTNGCRFGDTTTGAVDAWYVVSATATAQTSVTCNFDAAFWSANYNSCGVVEAAWSGSSISFDTSNGAVDTSCTSCASGSLTLGGTDYVFRASVTIPGSGITNISDAGFTNPKQFFSGTGAAGKLNVTGTDNPTWTQGSSTVTVMGIAFKGN